MLQIGLYTIYICVLCAYMHICTCVHAHMEARCIFGCHHSPRFFFFLETGATEPGAH